MFALLSACVELSLRRHSFDHSYGLSLFSAARAACKAMHMAEANQELAQALFSKKNKEKANTEERMHADAQARQRKLARMQAVRTADGSSNVPISVSFMQKN